MIERRRFIKSVTLTAVSAGLTLGMGRAALGQKRQPMETNLGFQIPMRAQQDALFYFTEATFRPYINGYFEAPNALGEMLPMKLVAVTSYDSKKASALMPSKVQARQTRSFSLMFQSTERLPPFTSIHNLRHPALGKFGVFLTPREKDGVFYYEAVFNHI